MFDPGVSEAEQRLDRMEREARRRKLGSAINGWSREAAIAGGTPPAGLLVAREAAAEIGATPPPDDRVLELMAERLDLLERKAARLEAEIRRCERGARRYGRLATAVALAALALILLGVPLAFGH